MIHANLKYAMIPHARACASDFVSSAPEELLPDSFAQEIFDPPDMLPVLVKHVGSRRFFRPTESKIRSHVRHQQTG